MIILSGGHRVTNLISHSQLNFALIFAYILKKFLQISKCHESGLIPSFQILVPLHGGEHAEGPARHLQRGQPGLNFNNTIGIATV